MIDTSTNNQKYLPLGSGDFVVVSSEEPPLQHSITPRLRIKTKIIELKKALVHYRQPSLGLCTINPSNVFSVE